jgi:hypothetical protein
MRARRQSTFAISGALGAFGGAVQIFVVPK